MTRGGWFAGRSSPFCDIDDFGEGAGVAFKMAGGISIDQLEAKLFLGTFAIFILFSTVFDFCYDYIEEELQDQEHYQFMVRKMFKELINLGLITISLILINDFVEISDVTFNTIHVAHLWLFLAVFSFVLQALFTMILVRKLKERWDNAFSVKEGIVRTYSKVKVLKSIDENFDHENYTNPPRPKILRLLIGKRNVSVKSH